MAERVFNFAAGPAVLPESVLREAQENLFALPEIGMSILEMSHRSKTVIDIMDQAEADIRALASIPDNYSILFLQGGASLQFSMIPMNLVAPEGHADHIVSGHFAKIAFEEARKVAQIDLAGSTELRGFDRVPRQEELTLNPKADYLHFTSNNTIFGTEWDEEPDSGRVPLVGDISSNAFSRPLDVSKYGLIYAGAQKNLGVAGVTMVIVRDDLIERSQDTLPAMLSYKVQQKSSSAYNTPPVFGVYILGLVIKWIIDQGGLEEMERRNLEKSRLIYDAIDSSEFYSGHAITEDRSRMNVTFKLPGPELEQRFVEEANSNELAELRGHRSVGGIRASIYNAFPSKGVDALVSFMKEFERTNG